MAPFRIRVQPSALPRRFTASLGTWR